MTTEEQVRPRVERRQPHEKNIDIELIGIVYEVAFDPKFWPDLLESVACLFEDRRSANYQQTECPDDDLAQIQIFSDQIDKGEAQRLATLLPHLYRALKLKRDYNEADHSRGQAQAILDQFPIGVLLVNAKGKLISANQYALETLAESHSVFLQNNILCTVGKEQQKLLKDLIDKAANAPADAASQQVSSFKIAVAENELPISLLITPDPYPTTPYDRNVENCAAIFIATTSVRQQISETALQSLFKLTRAESRLAALLASGESLNQAADRSHITRNTAKVQLKSIFSKMGVSRQAELIKRILTSPAVFNPVHSGHEVVRLNAETNPKSHVNKEGHLILRDGRLLHYAEYGDPHGKPVIHLHGILGCRYERLPNDVLTKNIGVRLIIPDRPGYGRSGHNLNHGFVDFADDLSELIDYLDIQQCSIMGLSIGAIYALAFAYRSPARLHRIAMISSTPPFRSFSDFSGIPPSLKLLVAFSIYLPTAAQLIAEIAIKNACKNPSKFLANIPVGTSDRAILSNALFKKHFEVCLLAGSKNCHTGFVRDILLSAEPWPFPLEAIGKRIDFWHGTEDLHSPINRIKPVIDAIPDSHLYSVEGSGHFLIYDHWQEILDSLIH